MDNERIEFIIPVIAQGLELDMRELPVGRWQIKRVDGEWVTFEPRRLRYDGTDSECVVHLSRVKERVLADAFESHRQRWREAKEDQLGLVGWGITYPDDFWDDYVPPTLETEAANG